METLHKLRDAIADDARLAFPELVARTSAEQPYGFAIYTDDSLLGLDAAVNTIESYRRAASRPRASKFEAYWHTTSWEFEGGVTSRFEESNMILDSLLPELEVRDVRKRVLDTLISSLERLVTEKFFDRFNAADQKLIQVGITDSDDDESVAERSIQRLNPDPVWQRYQDEKLAAGY